MKGYKTARRLGWLLKTVITLSVAATIGLLVWRIFFSTAIPNDVRYLQANDRLTAAYQAQDGNISFRYQNQASITRAEKNSGYFSVVDCVFIPEAEQVQLVFRYNNSTIQHLAADYALTEIPQKSEALFDVTIVRTTDLTPEDKSDNQDPSTLAIERIQPTSAVRAETALYTYYRLIFDGVTVQDDTDGVLLDIYYLGDVDYSQQAYGTLCLCANGDKWLEKPLSSKDRQAFESALAQ